MSTSTLEMPLEISAHTNPFPGLRPFMFHEQELFFGRDEQYEQMIDKLSRTRFLAVVGTSGSGKSSLVSAGLLPALYSGLMMSAGPAWRIALFRPKDDPIRELALALNHRRVFGGENNENRSSLLNVTDIIDWPGLCLRIGREDKEGISTRPSSRILKLLPQEMQKMIHNATQKNDFEQGRKTDYIEGFNDILRKRDFYREKEFKDVVVTGEVKTLLERSTTDLDDSEVEKLNRLLLEAAYPQEIVKRSEIQTRTTEVTLRRGDQGLVEVVRQAKMAQDENLLVVVDQFEELFRYARISEHGSHGNQAAAFVKLLLEAKSQREIPIYVVLTMRSDYLGDCAKFWDLPEAINEGQYLIPRMTREQRREAIIGPIKVSSADISPQLVYQLLNDMGDSPDQLPILQHALMRTWNRWKDEHQDNKPIDVDYYNRVGRMAEAMSSHADEAYNKLSDQQKEVAKKLFQCLTEKGFDDRETRRPTKLEEISAITEMSETDLIPVINAFRREGRSFLIPSPRKPLTKETSIDISHESLIRNWKRLKEWVDEEARSASVYRRLAEDATFYEKGERELLGALSVQLICEWRDLHKPNRAWASRYHPNFDGAMKFLEESREARKKEIEEKEKQQREDLRRARRVTAIFLIGAFAFLVLAGVVFGLAYSVQRQARKVNVLNYMNSLGIAQRAYEASDFAAANQALGEALSTSKEDSDGVRGFEWYYLWRSSHNELSTLSGHTDQVLSVTSSHDGKLLASGSKDTFIKLWDASAKQELAMLSGHIAPVLSVAFSPDDKLLASGSADKTVKLWDINSRQEQKMPADHKEAVLSVAFSPDGKLLASGSADKTIKIWDTGKLEETKSLRGHTDQVLSVAFSPDGKLLASGSADKTIRLWNTETWEELAVLRLTAQVLSVAFSSDMTTLASGNGDGNVSLWDINSRQELKTLKGHKDAVLSVAFSPDRSILVSGSADKTIKIWDSTDKTIKQRYTDKDRQEERATLVGHSDYIWSVAFQRDGKTFVTGSADKTVKLWSTNKPQGLINLNGHQNPVLSAAFSPDGNLLASVSADTFIKLWDASTGQELPPLSGHIAPVLSVAFSPDRMTLASGSADGTVKLWDINSRQEQKMPADHKEAVLSVAFSPDGKLLASGSKDRTIKLWDVSARQELAMLSGHTEQVSSVAFSPDGRILASGSADGTVKLWDVNKKQAVKMLTSAHTKGVLSIAFSPVSRSTILASGSADGTVKLWDISTGQILLSLKADPVSVLCVTISTDGKRLVTGGADGALKFWDITLWNTDLQQPLATLREHKGPILSVAFSPNGRSIATGSADKTVKLWQAARDEDIMADQTFGLIGLNR